MLCVSDIVDSIHSALRDQRSSEKQIGMSPESIVVKAMRRDVYERNRGDIGADRKTVKLDMGGMRGKERVTLLSSIGHRVYCGCRICPVRQGDKNV